MAATVKIGVGLFLLAALASTGKSMVPVGTLSAQLQLGKVT